VTDRVPGIILAGGQSRRMGQDKALVTLAGRTLVSWTVARLTPQVSALAISRHDGQLAGVDPHLPILADAGESYDGPLAGLLAGLDWVAATEPQASHAVTVPVDAPFLPADFVAQLLALRDATGAAACVAASGGRRHPTAGLWPVAARHLLRDAMRDEGLRRIGSFLERLGAAEAQWPTEPGDPFLNLNTPEDLAAAEAVVLSCRVAKAEQTGSPQPC
jgi:molybdenum cofactor guanylyltransferase